MKPTNDTTLERSVVKIKQLQRASRRLAVVPRDPEQGEYLVQSASTPNTWYEVRLHSAALRGSCTCPWAEHGGINCKHVMAALREQYAWQGALSFWNSPADARRQHRRTLAGNRLYATLRPAA